MPPLTHGAAVVRFRAIDDREDALAYAGEAASVATVSYLISTPLLADYLEEGLSLHGHDDD